MFSSFDNTTLMNGPASKEEGTNAFVVTEEESRKRSFKRNFDQHNQANSTSYILIEASREKTQTVSERTK